MDNQFCDSPVTKMTSKHRGNTTCKELPEDLLAEIFKTLPVKYILRCMCVKKSWYNLIKTPTFITLYYNHHKIITQKYLLFMTSTKTLTVRFDDVQCEEYCRLRQHHHPFVHPFFDSNLNLWYTQSYGLICMSSMFRYLSYSPDTGYDPNIHLWNPLVQKYKTVPASPLSFLFFADCTWKALAFGFLPEVNDYVVVNIVKPLLIPNLVKIAVYSLNTNSWKETSQNNVSISKINYQEVVFVNGAAFWLGINLEKHRIVMCFDTKTDILREIQLPDLAAIELANPLIYPFGQSIACFVKDDKLNSLHMWVSKYDLIYGFSWENMMSVSLSEDVRELLGVRSNGEPILRKLHNLISYDLDNHEPNNFVHSWDCWTSPSYDVEDSVSPFFVSPFVETLVLLNTD